MVVSESLFLQQYTLYQIMYICIILESNSDNILQTILGSDLENLKTFQAAL